MRERTVFALVIISLLLLAAGYIVGTQVNLLPTPASSRAVLVDGLMRFLLGIATVIFLVVEGALLFAVLRFRRRGADDSQGASYRENTTLELVWTLVPAIIVVIIGFYSYRVLAAIERPESDPLVVEVESSQFIWSFHYPVQQLSSSELHLPVGRPVRLEITSKDVIHSFWVPDFRAKRDATPGQVSELLITPTLVGRFPIRCAELCGGGHAAMTSVVIVETQAEFDDWILSQAGPSQ